MFDLDRDYFHIFLKQNVSFYSSRESEWVWAFQTHYIMTIYKTALLNFQVCKQLAKYTKIDVALSVGGLDLRIQEAELRRNPDVVIGKNWNTHLHYSYSK